jgi:hypothetical protein
MPVSCPDHGDHQTPVDDFVDHSIVTHADPPCNRFTNDLSSAMWTSITLQILDRIQQAFSH